MKRSWLVIACWLLAAGSVFVVGEGRYTHDFDTPGESSQVAEVVEQRFPEHTFPDSIDVVVQADNVRAQDVRSRLDALLAKAAELPGVLDTVSPYQVSAPPRISADGTVALASIRLAGEAFSLSDELVPNVVRLRDEAATKGVRIELGGAAVADYETDVGGQAELVGFAVAFVVLALVFGSLPATLLPLLSALAGLGAGMAGIALLSQVMKVPGFAPQIAAMVGIGVGIDYALFLVTRYRQALAAGAEPPAAVQQAMRSAGRAVLVAGCVVVVALALVRVIGQPDIAALGLAISVVVLAVMLASLTLLPALLGILGRRIDWLAWRKPRSGPDPAAGWTFRWVRQVLRRPVLAATLSTAVLLLLCVPALSLRLGTTDAGDGPVETTSRRAYDLVAGAFGPGRTTPILVVASTTDAGGLRESLAGRTGVAEVSDPISNPSGDATAFQVYATTGPQAPETEQLVRDLRTALPSDALVGGTIALNLDNSDQIRTNLPWLFGAVIGCAFVLLVVSFRSLLIPLKAAGLNLLSIGAAYGVVVAVFQWGWGIGLLGLPGGAPIDSVLPILMFAITFGLSMDYEVFLLSQIREVWLRTGDNERAIAEGLGRTATVVTAAAAIMVAVFGAFTLGADRQLKVFGFGFAVPILLDVLLIRLVLVPALLRLMGRANWYLPGRSHRKLTQNSMSRTRQ